MIRRYRRGLSKVELLVFVGIVIVLVLLALPNVRSSRLQANHEITASKLLTISAANALYFQKYKQYAPTFMALYPDRYLMSQQILKATNVALEKPHEGYYYFYNAKPPYQTFLMFSTPADYQSSGVYSFVVNELDEIFQRDVHENENLTKKNLHSQFQEVDYSVPGRSSPWKFRARNTKVVLGTLEDDVWEKSEFDREDEEDEG